MSPLNWPYGRAGIENSFFTCNNIYPCLLPQKKNGKLLMIVLSFGWRRRKLAEVVTILANDDEDDL